MIGMKTKLLQFERLASHRTYTLFRFLLVLLIALSIASVALADAGGYAQTGVDRFDHSFDTKLTGEPAKDIVTIALAQKGKSGQSLGYTYDWCAAFVTDCAKYAGISNLIPFVSGHTHGCGGDGSSWGYLHEYMVRAGASEVGTSNARAGDIVFFGYTGTANFCHVGIVTGSNATVEGNCGGSGTTYLTRTVKTGTISGRGYTRISVLRPQYPDPQGTLDLNGYLDGVTSGSLGVYGTADVYINGSRVADDKADYCTSHRKGTSYEIKDIKANPGYEYLSVRNGSLSGTISAGTIDVRLSFAKQGSLTVYGLLDGVSDSSTNGYGTFDVYIGGVLDEANCTSYNKQWPNGTTYVIKNIQVSNGKNYSATASANLSGTITSNKQSKVTLSITSDGTASTEWQIGKYLPGNLNPDELDIQYDNHYETVASSSPGSGWIQGSIVSTEYVNNGGTYESHIDLPTSNTRTLVSYYYYHWCAMSGDNANYESTSKYVHYDRITDVSSVIVDNTDIDAIDSSYTIYNLKWKNGGWAYCNSGITCSGDWGSHSERSYHWYKMNIYQDKLATYKYKWTKDTGWTSNYDSTATSHNVRWRYKGGIPPVPPEEYHLTINGWLDGVQTESTSGYGIFDLYVDGELVAEGCTGIQTTFDHNVEYSIQNIQTFVGKKYDGVHLGKISGNIVSGNAVVSLSFVTLMDIDEEWTEAEILPEGLDLTGCEVEYKNHYETIATSSPGNGWIQAGLVSTEYVNTGSPYESHTDLPTSNTRVLVSYYYYHWCSKTGNNANYEMTSNYVHFDQISNVSSVYVDNTDIDAIDSSYTIYNLRWTNGNWAYCKSGTTCDASYGTHGERSYHWYKMNTYQDKTPVYKYKWTKDSDWTSQRDPQATSARARVRLKRYDVYLDGNGGTSSTNIYKYYDMPLYLEEYTPIREDYVFTGWNTSSDGSGVQFESDAVYTENTPLTLYAQWNPITISILPAGTDVIEEEAFAGSGMRIVRIPSGCTSIHAGAFAGCMHLSKIYIPGSVTYIDSSAFDGLDSLIIVGEEDSIAELYAFKRDWITFETGY